MSGVNQGQGGRRNAAGEISKGLKTKGAVSNDQDPGLYYKRDKSQEPTKPF